MSSTDCTILFILMKTTTPELYIILNFLNVLILTMSIISKKMKSKQSKVYIKSTVYTRL